MKKNKFFYECDSYCLLKTFRIMRITIFLLFVSFLQTFANNSYSQKTRLSLNISNTKLVDAMDEIEELSEFYFLYNEKFVDTEREVSVSVENQQINEILDELFTGTDVKYTITDRKIILTPDFLTEGTSQQKSVTGTVTDEKGQPLPGVTIVIKGTTQGTVSDIDGNFEISDVAATSILQFSFVGMKSQEIAVGSQSSINVQMFPDAIGLDEVVAIGYGVQKKSNVTGAITSIDNKTLESRSVENVQQALQGKAAGVMVYSSSGAPGANPQIRIRGLSSNNSDASEPLYIVDGLEVSNISYLDPAIIKSMEILKDGASAAIYGAEAGNGVILITTKSGATGSSRIFYNTTYGITSMGKKPELMNAEQFVAYQRASGNGTLMEPWNGETDTNWADVMYGDGGTLQRHTLGFEAGTDRGTLYAAATYLDNDGMYYGDKDYLKRLTFQVNATYKIKPWLEFISNNSIETSKSSMNSDWTQKSRMINSVYLYDPISPVSFGKDNIPSYMQSLINQYGDDLFMKNESGDYISIPRYLSDSVNPLTWYYAHDATRRSINIRGTSAINFKPFSGFTYTSRLGYRLLSSDYNFFGKPVYTSVSPRLKLDYQAQNSMTKFYQWENFVNYMGSFGKHDINAMAGTSYKRNWYNYTKGGTDEFTNDGDNYRYLSYSNSGANDYVSGEVAESASISYFGRIGYTYDNRYNIQLNLRADAYDSSKLAQENRWGYFPSVAVGWTVSNEQFMSKVNKDVLSSLKVRASWGENGNINVLNGYPYQSSLSVTDYYPINGALINTIAPSSVLANPSLMWEEAKQIDVGVDARFLSNRLQVTADYFDKNTSGQLISMTAPLSSGASSVIRNVGKVNNHGFEFEIGWEDRINDFTYGVDLNLATLSNEVKDLGSSTRIGNANDLAYTFNYFDKGQPIWSYWGWDYMGVAENGEAIYRDVDDNDNIDTYDKVYLGSAIPKFTYGITINAAYKNFDFMIFGSGSHGGKLSMSNRARPTANAPEVLWTESFDVKGANAKYPHPNVNGDSHMWYSDMVLFDGSYFKIKQIQLGYTVPKNILQRVYISDLRVFMSMDNYFCFTKYPGMDPEAINSSNAMGIDVGEYPSPKTMTFGLNISF